MLSHRKIVPSISTLNIRMECGFTRTLHNRTQNVNSTATEYLKKNEKKKKIAAEFESLD